MPIAAFTIDTHKDTYEDVRAIVDAFFNVTPAPPVLTEAEPMDWLAEEEPEPEPENGGKELGVRFNSTIWTESKMRRYVRQLTPQGLRILRALVDHGPHVGAAEIKVNLGIAQREFSGSMSTFGWARNNTRGVYGRPFMKTGKTYFMPPKVAALADAELTALGE